MITPKQRWIECVTAFGSTTENFSQVLQSHLFQYPLLATMNDEFGITMLHYAAAKGDRDSIRSLLDLGADPKARNSCGDTPRDDAIQFEHPEVLDLLTPRSIQGLAA